MTTTQNTESLYTEVPGCTTYIKGESGTTKGFTYTQNRKSGAFVQLDMRDAMIYVTLGVRSGTRDQHSEVLSSREIDRDEFDRLNGIDLLRTELGWQES